MKLNAFKLSIFFGWTPLIRKIIMIINFTTVLMIFALLQVSANGFSQISLNKRNTPLEAVFKSIEKQTDYVFFSKDNDYKNKDINIHVNNVSIETALDACFKDLPLTYKIIDKTIVVRKSEKREPANVSGNTKNVAIDIQGRVTDAKGDALVGVSIKLKGSTIGTVTNNDGAYSISIPDGKGILVFSYIGFSTQEISTSNSQTLNVTLLEAESGLDEVVVVGYGTVSKKDLTGAVSTLQGDLISARKTTQVSQALQGAVPGLMVTRNNNAPGATASIRIRGITTITDAGSNPLIILDGVPIDDINSINPNDIDNISVLKDAASASIYGSRAASGVIMVTTKRAKEGQIALDYSAEYGFEKATEVPDYAGAIRFMQLTNELRWNDNGNNANEYPIYTQDVIDNYNNLNADNPDQYPNTDWRGLIMNNTAPRQSHNLGISGSGNFISTRASFGYDKTDALYDGRTYERLTSRINNDVKISSYLKASVDINFRRTNINQPVIDPMYKMGIVPPIYAAIWSDGRIGAGKDGANIYARLKEGGFDHAWYNQVGGKIALDFTPLEGLKFSGIVSPFLNADKVKNFNKKIPYTTWSNPDAVAGYIEGATETKLTETRNDSYRYTIQFLANYNKQLADHTFDLLAGYEYYYAFNENLGASRGQYILSSYPYLNLGPPEFRDNNGSAYENAYRSWFSRFMYNYKGRYLLQANIRFDASSRFASDYRWGSFPSVSGGWVISEESFFKEKVPFISFLKLRASYGTLGNERIGNYPYQAILNFENSSLFYQGNKAVTGQSAAQFQYAIRDISWETTQSFDIGLDINLLNNRLSIIGDYYKKTTKDMLLELEIPDYVGFDNPNQNTGKMFTKGWEMQVGWNDRHGDFNYSASFNLSDFKSKMGDLGGTEFLGDQIKIQGSEFNEWYGYISEGLYQTQQEVDASATLNANVKPGDVRYKDISGPDGVPDGKISPEYDKVLLGGSLPRYMYGANFQFGYKNWDLGLVLQGVGKQNSRLGADIIQPLRENYGNFPAILDGESWSHYQSEEQNLNAKYPRYSNTSAGNNYALSNFWLINGAYFRLKNINVGYSLPKFLVEKIHMKDIHLYASVNDLFSKNNYPKGWDPEMNSLAYPITTTVLFGALLKF